jgi:hypothetical protein
MINRKKRRVFCFFFFKIKNIFSQETKQKKRRDKHDLKFTKNHYFEKLSAQLKTRTHTHKNKKNLKSLNRQKRIQ